MSRRITQGRPMPPLPKFRAWLATQGKGQAQIADRVGVTQRCISYWANRQRWPTVESLRDAPEALRALADDLEALNGHR
jgi:transcriptional regulator with XRE-family HTH domain